MDVSVLGFGGSEIGYERAGARTVARLLGGALDAGLNVIDTAECYEDSESLIGGALGSRRDEIHLLTKCGHPRGFGRGNWREASLLSSIERSLKRLRTDRLDLIQLHSCEVADLRKGEAITALERARERGETGTDFLPRPVGHRGIHHVHGREERSNRHNDPNHNAHSLDGVPRSRLLGVVLGLHHTIQLQPLVVAHLLGQSLRRARILALCRGEPES